MRFACVSGGIQYRIGESISGTVPNEDSYEDSLRPACETRRHNLELDDRTPIRNADSRGLGCLGNGGTTTATTLVSGVAKTNSWW